MYQPNLRWKQRIQDFAIDWSLSAEGKTRSDGHLLPDQVSQSTLNAVILANF